MPAMMDRLKGKMAGERGGVTGGQVGGRARQKVGGGQDDNPRARTPDRQPTPRPKARDIGGGAAQGPMDRPQPRQGLQRPQPAEDAFQSRPAPAAPAPQPQPIGSGQLGGGLGGGASALGQAPSLPGLAGGGAAPLGPPPVSQAPADFMQSRMRDPLAALGGRSAGNVMGVNPMGGGMFLRQLGLQ